MHALIRRWLPCLCLLLQLAVPPVLAARTVVTHTEVGNSYTSGSDLLVNQSIPGDLFAAGGRVTVRQPVGADAAVAGGSVDIRTDIGQDLRAAGGNVNVDGQIGGELVAAGGTVSIVDGSAVSGPSLLAGSDVIVGGRLGQGAKIYANRITLNGEIDGDAHFYAREIVFGPRAWIDGNLFYASAEPLPEEWLASISGRVVREKTPPDWSQASSTQHGGGMWFHTLFFLGMLSSGIVLYLLFPRAVEGVRDSIDGAPLRSVVAGLALLFTVPPVAVLLMLTLIGIPLGLGLFVLYPLLLMLGYLATAFFIGRRLADVMHQPRQAGKRRQALFLGLALLILALVGAFPVVGWLFVFVSLAAGTGGWAIWAVHGYRAAHRGAGTT